MAHEAEWRAHHAQQVEVPLFSPITLLMEIVRMNARIVKAAGITTAVIMLVIVVFGMALTDRNDKFSWCVKQSFFGGANSFEIINEPGWFWKGLASVTKYPDVIEIYGNKSSSKSSPGDDSAHCKFNDGGTCDFDWYARIRTPKPGEHATPEEIASVAQQQREFHRMVRGPDNARVSVRSHVRECMGVTGNMMSASENQALKRALFYSLAYGQIKDGLYETKTVTVRRKGGVADLIKTVEGDKKDNPSVPGAKPDSTPKPRTSSGVSIAQQQEVVVGEESVEASDTVRAAEPVLDSNGKPVISKTSPLERYGVAVIQFSIGRATYDVGTQGKFNEKRTLLLEAENARATAVQNAQDRLKNIAEGNQQIAITEAVANQEKAKQVITAQMGAEVEGILTELNEVDGQTKVLVAGVMNKQLTAERDAAIADAKTAENARKAAEIQAAAKQQMIDLGGATTDAETTLQKVYTDRVKAQSLAMQKLKMPDTVIISMDAVPTGKSPLEMAMPSLRFLEAAGASSPLLEEISTSWKPKAGTPPKIDLPKPVDKPIK